MTLDQSGQPTTIEELLLCLVDPRQNAFGGWTTRCPCNAAHVLLLRPPSQPGRLWCANGCSAGLLRTALGFDPEIVGLDPPEAQFNENSKGTASRGIVTAISEPESRLEPEISTPTAIPEFLNRPAAVVVKPLRSDLEAEIRRLHDEGLSNREIARRVQMHHTSVGRILKSEGAAL
jgi:Helix-turn-helix domain